METKASFVLIGAFTLAGILAGFGFLLWLAKVEVDEGDNMKIAGRYQARGFPTVMLFVGGEEVDRFSGAKPLSFIRDFVESNLA